MDAIKEDDYGEEDDEDEGAKEKEGEGKISPGGKK